MSKYILCSNYGYKFFIEYMKTFYEYIPIILDELTSDIIISAEEIIILQSSLFIPDNILKNINKISILNTEQLCKETVLKKFLYMINNLKNITKKEIFIYDYSNINKELLQNEGYNVSVRYPKSSKDDIMFLKNLIKNNEKIYDVGFIGCVNDRRKKILNDLTNSDIKVKIISDNYGYERDLIISQCKIIVNIHYEHYFNIFESIRCNRLLEAEMIVISENSLDIPLGYKNLYLVEYNNLVYFINNYLKINLK
jgi:hypothetical protein